MKWEYRQWVVSTQGWIDLKLPDQYIDQLNKWADQGWEVDQMMPLHTGMAGSTAVVFLLRRQKMQQ